MKTTSNGKLRGNLKCGSAQPSLFYVYWLMHALIWPQPRRLILCWLYPSSWQLHSDSWRLLSGLWRLSFGSCAVIFWYMLVHGSYRLLYFGSWHIYSLMVAIIFRTLLLYSCSCCYMDIHGRYILVTMLVFPMCQTQPAGASISLRPAL